jgi:hypothetical protein
MIPPTRAGPAMATPPLRKAFTPCFVVSDVMLTGGYFTAALNTKQELNANFLQNPNHYH